MKSFNWLSLSLALASISSAGAVHLPNKQYGAHLQQRDGDSCPSIKLPEATTVSEAPEETAATLAKRDGLYARESTWDEYLKKGEKLWKDLTDTLNDDNYKDKACMSDFNDNYDVSGYRVSPPSRNLKVIFQKIGLSIEATNHNYVAQRPKGLTDTESSTETWTNSFSPDTGVIIAQLNERASKDAAHWSQIAWLFWQQTCAANSGDISGLKWVFQSDVENDKTVEIIHKIVGGEDNLTEEPVCFTPDCGDEFYTLLYSPNGNGIARLLIENKNALKSKTIKQICLAKKNVVFMWAEIEPYESG